MKHSVVCLFMKRDILHFFTLDIAIHWSQLPSHNPFQEDSDQCLPNYMTFNKDHIDDYASKGVNCSKKNSKATDGTWTYNGSVVDCGHSAVCYMRHYQDQSPYIHYFDMLEVGHLGQMVFIHVVLKRLY